MTYKIEEIEGIGPANAEKLAIANITTTEELLNLCGSKSGRETVSTSTSVSETLLLKWVNIADLMRIKGVGSEWSELLEAAGVDTVKELATRNAANLTATIATTNEEKKLARAVPTEAVVQGWIDQAKDMSPVVTH